MCFICCAHIIPDSSRQDAIISSDQAHRDFASLSSHLPPDIRTSNKFEMPEELSPHSVSSADVVNNSGSLKAKEHGDSATTENFWTHVFHCLQDRGQALCRARLRLEEIESNDCLVMHYPSVDFGDDHAAGCDTTTITESKNQKKSEFSFPLNLMYCI